MERRDTWAYGLAGLDVAAVLVWWPVTGVDTFAPFVLGEGHWWLLPPAVLLFLGCLGLWMWGREWLTGQQHQRIRGSTAVLPWASALVLMPLLFYAWLAMMLATFPSF